MSITTLKLAETNIRKEHESSKPLTKHKLFSTISTAINMSRSYIERIEHPTMPIQKLLVQLFVYNDHIRDHLIKTITDEDERQKVHENRPLKWLKPEKKALTVRLVVKNKPNDNFPEEKKYYEALAFYKNEMKRFQK